MGPRFGKNDSSVGYGIVDGLIPLSRMRAGQSGRIGRIIGHADHVHRLEEFGLCGGTEIEVFRSGDPCIICASGQKVCFRANNAVNILVETPVMEEMAAAGERISMATVTSNG